MRRFPFLGRSILSFGAAVALAAGLPAASAADPPPKADSHVPRLAIEKPEFDAGEVVKGKDVEAVFLVRNDGQGELRLLSVKPG